MSWTPNFRPAHSSVSPDAAPAWRSLRHSSGGCFHAGGWNSSRRRYRRRGRWQAEATARKGSTCSWLASPLMRGGRRTGWRGLDHSLARGFGDSTTSDPFSGSTRHRFPATGRDWCSGTPATGKQASPHCRWTMSRSALFRDVALPGARYRQISARAAGGTRGATGWRAGGARELTDDAGSS